MFKIDWDKQKVEHKIRTGEGGKRTFLDFWIPIHIIVNGVDISGLDEVPGGEISNLDSLLLNILYIFHSIDPENLPERKFHFVSNVKNKVSGGGFDFYVFYEKNTDVVTLRYKNFVHKEWQNEKISLNDFAQGAIRSTAKLLNEVVQVDPYRRNDVNYVVMREDMELLENWYKNKYGEDLIDNR